MLLGGLAERVAAAAFVFDAGAAGAGLVAGGRGCSAKGQGLRGGSGGGLIGLQAFGESREVALEAEPHLLVEGLVALELAVGFVGGEVFVDGDFVKTLGFEIGLFLGLDAADTGEVALGVFEFGLEEIERSHV
jgi:hypothetical protein